MYCLHSSIFASDIAIFQALKDLPAENDYHRPIYAKCQLRVLNDTQNYNDIYTTARPATL
ncbi:hypothetical protein DYY65_08240 [Nitrososphaera sp. AFS]|nr:hypothetical protein [Nitrososphaera sp. AFS]